MIFVREATDSLTSLVKLIDERLGAASASRNPEARKLGVYVVFCNDSARLKVRLRAMVVREKLKRIVLCAAGEDDDNWKDVECGPDTYALAKEAALTAVIYDKRRRVTANIALRRGEFDTDKFKQIVDALGEVLPKK